MDPAPSDPPRTPATLAIVALIIALISGVAAAACLSVVFSPGRVVRAKQFSLTDGLDRERARLTAEGSGAVRLSIYDTGFDNPITVVFEPAGSGGVITMTDAPGSPTLTVDWSASGVAILATEADGSTTVVPFDPVAEHPPEGR